MKAAVRCLGMTHHIDIISSPVVHRMLGPVFRWLWMPLLLAGAWPLCASASDALRCGSRLVSVEDRAATLINVCGEPSYRDRWSPQDGGGAGFIGDTEEWTYNFGSSQLLRIVRLRNGRIVDITSDGYGFREPPPNDRHCAPERVVDDVSKYRLLSMCGDPVSRTAISVFRSDRPGGYRRGAVVAVYREEWVYDFGPNLLMRVVTLENGRIVDVENAERGRR